MRIQRPHPPPVSDEMTGYSADNRTLDAATGRASAGTAKAMAATVHITGITNLLFMKSSVRTDHRGRSWFTATL
jgi:predicted benzoate:H+ symporter BenE